MSCQITRIVHVLLKERRYDVYCIANDIATAMQRNAMAEWLVHCRIRSRHFLHDELV